MQTKSFLKSKRAIPGAVIEGRKRQEDLHYFKMKEQNFFSLFRRMPIELMRGKNSVSVGLTDFSQLLNSEILSNPAEPNNTKKSCGFFAFEHSTFSTARSKIIMEMMKDICVEINSIIQVWFSSLWEKQTYEDFKSVVRRMLINPINSDSKDNYNALSDSERVLLAVWSNLTEKDLSPAKAIKVCLLVFAFH